MPDFLTLNGTIYWGRVRRSLFGCLGIWLWKLEICLTAPKLGLASSTRLS